MSMVSHVLRREDLLDQFKLISEDRAASPITRAVRSRDACQ